VTGETGEGKGWTPVRQRHGPAEVESADGRDHGPRWPSTRPRQLCERDPSIPRAWKNPESLFAGSDGGARHWAIVASLVTTAKLNGVEPLAWLTDVLERVVAGRTKAHELARLLPWNWKAEHLEAAMNARTP
jgi:hypothetical protein